MEKVAMSPSRRLDLEVLEDRTLLNAGMLDPTFGGGEVVTPFSTGADTVLRVAVQADGKLIVVGSEGVPDSSRPPTSSFPPLLSDVFVARYSVDGRLDPTFGTGGKVVTDFPAGTFRAAVTAQAGGKILVTGSFAGASASGYELARFNPDGGLDATFGRGGEVLDTTLSGYDAQAEADGMVLVDGSDADGTLVVARYDAQGQLDATFGAGGKIRTDFRTALLAAQSDGKVVLAGSLAGASGSGPEVARYNADGSPDATFGTGGQVAVPAALFVAAVAVEPDGKILLAGTGSNPTGPAESVLVRLNAEGTPDAGFGTGGTVGDVALPQAVALALQADGRILVAGTDAGPTPGVPDSNLALARYRADGSLDPSFGVGGHVSTDFGAAELANGLAIGPDGKIVVVGSTGQPLGDTFVTRHSALARYLGDDPSADLPQRFVTQAYRTLLHRPPDAVGLSDFSGLLRSGRATPAQVVQLIEGSAEYRGVAVNDLYSRLLGRPADAFGLGAFTASLAAGGTLAAVEAAILGSPEYASHHNELGGSASQVFLNGLYTDVLGRLPDASGETTFTRMLQAGAGRSAVAAAVLASAEAAWHEVGVLYQTFLGRQADAFGQTAFTNALLHGVPVEAVVAAILGSEESLQHV
jgi:uncharacterized delta-60 repeat protein